MVVIGITGGVAAGKSFVTRELARCGAAVIDADRVGHGVLRLVAVKLALYQRWGTEVFHMACSGQSSDSSAGRLGTEQSDGRQDSPTPVSAGSHPARGTNRADGAVEGAALVAGWSVNRAAVADRVFAPTPEGQRALAFWRA